MRSFLLLAFMSANIVATQCNILFYHGNAGEQALEWLETSNKTIELSSEHDRLLAEEPENETHKEILEKIRVIQTKLHQNFLNALVIIAKNKSPDAIMAYQYLPWINPDCEITDELINILNEEYAKEQKQYCNYPCE